MDISTLSLSELKDLLSIIPGEIKRREKEERAKALRDLHQLASDRGFTLDELLGEGKQKKTGKTVAVKYRHPENADVAWTGRGRQPKWVVEFIAAGGSIEQLAV